MLNDSKSVEFANKFEKYLGNYRCPQHKKTPTFVCVHQLCQERGLICSSCLTVTGKHKNHDALDLMDFYEICTKEQTILAKKTQSITITRDDNEDMVRQISTYYEDLLKMLMEFHENYSNTIKGYIEKKAQHHTSRLSTLQKPTKNTSNSSSQALNKLEHCNFQSIDEVNLIFNLLINQKVLNKIEDPKASIVSNSTVNDSRHPKSDKEIAQNFLDDVRYESFFIGRELRKIQSRLKELLVVKESTPVVLNQEPTFCQPTYIEDDKMVYMGEQRAGMPHGQGICYFKDAGKIIFGSFDSGKVQGNAELYFLNGDYYIGQFRDNKKQGRGVYRWDNSGEANVYQGQFQKGRRNGRGTFWWGDNSRYEGHFLHGAQKGYGILYRGGKNKQYEGQWLNGLYEGYGVQYFESGQKYSGYFKDDKFHGKGTFSKSDGTVIKGIWQNNQLAQVSDGKP